MPVLCDLIRLIASDFDLIRVISTKITSMRACDQISELSRSDQTPQPRRASELALFRNQLALCRAGA